MNTAILTAAARAARLPSAIWGTSCYLDFVCKNLVPTKDLSSAAWTKTNCSISGTANYTTTSGANPGTKTFQKIVEATGTVTPTVSYTLSAANSAVFTMQRLFVAAERSWIRMRVQFSDGTATGTWFDVQNGVKGSTTSNVTTAALLDSWIVSLGGGVYLVSMTVRNSSTGSSACVSEVRVAPSDGSNSHTGNGTSGLWTAEPVDRFVTVATGENIYADPNPQYAQDVKATPNFADWSEDITVGWGATGILSKNQSGTTISGWKAFKVIPSNGSTGPSTFRATTNWTPNTTMWARAVFKAAELKHARLAVNTFSNANPLINVINLDAPPSILSALNGATNAFITSLGNGWYEAGFQFSTGSGVGISNKRKVSFQTKKPEFIFSNDLFLSGSAAHLVIVVTAQ